MRIPISGCERHGLSVATNVDVQTLGNTEDTLFHVGVDGAFGANHVSPRTLVRETYASSESLSRTHFILWKASHLLSKLVCIDGIVTTASSVRPKVGAVSPAPIFRFTVLPQVAKSVHYCPATKNTINRE